MRPLTKWMLLLCAVTLGLPGCSQTAKVTVNDGAGFVLNDPDRESAVWLINHNLPLYKRISGNDEFCMKQPGCRKTP